MVLILLKEFLFLEKIHIMLEEFQMKMMFLLYLKKRDLYVIHYVILSVAEQILLFNNAEIVVAEQGSGLTNILFCNPETKVVEIFQALIDNCFWWLSNVMQLNYIPVKTLEVDVDYFANCLEIGLDYLGECGKSIINIPLDEIKKIAEKL